MDPTLVRVLWVVLTLVLGGAPLIVYIVMLFVVPEEGSAPQPPAGRPAGQPGDWQPGGPSGWQPTPPSASPGPVPTPPVSTPPAPTPPAPTPPESGRAEAAGDDVADQQVWGEAGAPWDQPKDSAPEADPSSDAGDTDVPATGSAPAPGSPGGAADADATGAPDDNPADHNQQAGGGQPLS